VLVANVMIVTIRDDRGGARDLPRAEDDPTVGGEPTPDRAV